jgi:transmembrane sensor
MSNDPTISSPSGDPLEWVPLQRVIADEASAEERAAVEAWVAAEPGRAALLAGWRAVFTATRDLRRPFDTDAAWARVGIHVSGRGHAWAARIGGRSLRWRNVRRLIMPLATTALGVAAIVVGVEIAHQSGSGWHEYATRRGERETVRLADGTEFTLAPASRLRVPLDYSAGNRSVRLDGEAYFAVVHDAQHPFSVRATNLIATDIGTAFDVRAYSSDRAKGRVAVVEGVVGVRILNVTSWLLASRAQQALSAGDVGVVTDTALETIRTPDVTRYVAWMQGGLVFNDTPLRDAVRDLERVYDIDIAVSDSTLLAQSITARFSAEPVDQVLAAVTTAVGAQYQRTGRRVVIARRPATRRGPHGAQTLVRIAPTLDVRE